MRSDKLTELLKKPAEIDWEELFLGDIVSDMDMDYLNQCRNLPALAFENYDHRKTWQALKATTTYEEVMDVGMDYMDKGSSGMKYFTARQKVYLHALAVMGFDKVDKWRATLPAKFKDQENGWESVTAVELEANPPDKPNELLHGMLRESGTMMMSGASKSMKTFTMIDAGLSVATGTTWLGVQCAKAAVVYLNLELSGYSMATRVQAIAHAKGIEPPADFHVMNLRGQLVTIDTLESKLAKLIEKTGARLVIIDPHYKISSASGVEENSNDAQGLLLYRLENTVCKSGAALMLAHHFSKGDKSQTKAIDRAAGGGALARWPDVVMTLTEHEEADCAVAEFSLRDFAPIAPFVVRWTYPAWSRAEGVNPTLLKKAGRHDEHPASQLLEKLKPGMTNAEWRNASGWSEGTFKRKRVELEESGKVRLVSALYYRNPPQSPQ